MSASNKTGPTTESVIVQLHINDLRTTDSPVLSLAHSQGKKHVTHFLPIYVFDERILPLDCIPGFSASRQTKAVQEKTPSAATEKGRDEEEEDIKPLGQEDQPSRTNTNQPATKDRDHRSTGRVGPRSRLGNFWRVGRHRARFLVETVFDLKKTYDGKGGGLIVACGKPEEVAIKVVEALLKSGKRVEGVWTQKEVTTEEVTLLRRLRHGLEQSGVELHLVDSKPMINPSDLPFKIEDIPSVFTSFRKLVEALGDDMVRDPLPEVKKVKPLPQRPASLSKDVFLLSGELLKLDTILRYILAPLIAEPQFGDALQARPIPKTDEEWKAYVIPPLDPRSAHPFIGGETTGLARLDDYFGTLSGGQQCKGEGGLKAMSYKDTRNGMVGEAFSTKFSGWLANGSLSGRYIGWRVRQLQDRLRAEGRLDKHVEGNVYWISFELLWRDFFYWTCERFSHEPSYTAKKNNQRKNKGQPSDGALPGEAGTASSLFNLGGWKEVLRPAESQKTLGDWKGFNLDDSKDPIRRLMEGNTGIPFLDACMRELATTGFMSNRGRQNVASFWGTDLYIDWRVGAEIFETHLIDFDVCSNWGNWQYQAGVGNDPRSYRQFNQIKQANDYDPDGEYVLTWIPELGQVDRRFVHTPWLLSDAEKKRCGIGAPGGYPASPLLVQPQWKKHYPSNRAPPKPKNDTKQNKNKGSHQNGKA
ncbi:hypothetical protein QFC22_006395 [Naganishia vaughanmartiniae]|uniref:Uncharacterized protein n=1 Tax=Naganishia vaughanmartiniae TaxID=1424756 RepID=A0ACC2WLP6_9TREE|nr:hypothetical protein QFC22_006395 [Naganishia vaughanmartiniae]